MDTDRTGPPVASGWRFRTPPGWPEPPAGWRPAPGWAPDPQWPPAPPGWQFWEFDTEDPGPYGTPPQAQPVHASAAHGAGQTQPIENWAARPRQNQGLGTALLVLGALVLLSDILSAVTAPAAVHAYEAAAAEGRDPTQIPTAHDATALLYFVVLPATWIVGSLWLSRARENAVLIAPDQVRRSAVWVWLGWLVPIVSWWFPKQIVDDSWRITSSSAAVGQRGRYPTPACGWCCWWRTCCGPTWPRDSWAATSTRGSPRPGDRGGDTWQPGLRRLGARGPRPVPGPSRTGPGVRACWPGLRVERECALLDRVGRAMSQRRAIG
jgi:hypothetical protein